MEIPTLLIFLKVALTLQWKDTMRLGLLLTSKTSIWCQRLQLPTGETAVVSSKSYLHILKTLTTSDNCDLVNLGVYIFSLFS